MALSNKNKLLKRLKKMKKRKKILAKRARHSVVSRDVDEDNELKNEPISTFSEKRNADYLSECYEEFLDDDDACDEDEVSSVDSINMQCSDLINALADKIEDEFHSGLTRFQNLCIAFDGWNLAKDSMLDINVVSTDLAGYLEEETEIDEGIDLVQLLQFIADEIKSEEKYQKLPVVLMELSLTRLHHLDLGIVMVTACPLKGKRQMLLNDVKMELAEERV